MCSCSKENEKKVLASMLSKLYVTSNSTFSKLQKVFDLVTEAIDSKISNDVLSRNSLTKFHTALSKAIADNCATETATKTRESSAKGEMVLVAVDRESEKNIQEGGVKLGEEDGDEEDKVMQNGIVKHEDREDKDSILDELLDDEAEM